VDVYLFLIICHWTKLHIKIECFCRLMHDYNLHCFLTKVKVLNQKHLINGKVLMASKIKTSSSKIKTKVAFLIVLLEIEFQFA
jgi:hypothetical protein